MVASWHCETRVLKSGVAALLRRAPESVMQKTPPGGLFTGVGVVSCGFVKSIIIA